MMTSGSEIVLKRQVISYWEQSALNRPVKISRIIRDPELWAEGYFTSYKFIAGRTLPEIERILGFNSRYLIAGAYFYEFSRLPYVEEFELKGYSQCPDGSPWTAMSGYPAGAGAPQWKIKKFHYIPVRLLAIVEYGSAFIK